MAACSEPICAPVHFAEFSAYIRVQGFKWYHVSGWFGVVGRFITERVLCAASSGELRPCALRLSAMLSSRMHNYVGAHLKLHSDSVDSAICFTLVHLQEFDREKRNIKEQHKRGP